MRILDLLNENWLMATQIHKLEARLWRRVQKDQLQVVIVTSAERGEGKSTTVALLSAALGQYPDRRILAVDLDLREPQLSSHLEVVAPGGLTPVFTGDRPVDHAICKTELPNLDLLCPAPEKDDPSLLLRTAELDGVFQVVRKRYDFILVDVPALLPVADTSLLIPLADGVILVAMAGRTTRPHLNQARAICLGLDANLLGLIVGNVQGVVPSYGSGSYYGKRNGKYRGNGKRERAEGD